MANNFIMYCKYWNFLIVVCHSCPRLYALVGEVPTCRASPQCFLCACSLTVFWYMLLITFFFFCICLLTFCNSGSCLYALAGKENLFDIPYEHVKLHGPPCGWYNTSVYITSREVNDHAWMRVWLSFWGSSCLHFSPHPLLWKSWGATVVVLGCGGTNRGTLLLLHPILSSPFLCMHVVNECCMKRLRPASCWKWT